MSNSLGPLEICCDAPPFDVVRACGRLGFHSPLDVRWCRMSHFLADKGGPFGSCLWEWVFAAVGSREKPCTCGEPLPTLEQYAITLACNQVADYLLGQCPLCRTIFWEEG
jgi:hypothetical protein